MKANGRVHLILLLNGLELLNGLVHKVTEENQTNPSLSTLKMSHLTNTLHLVESLYDFFHFGELNSSWYK